MNFIMNLNKESIERSLLDSEMGLSGGIDGNPKLQHQSPQFNQQQGSNIDPSQPQIQPQSQQQSQQVAGLNYARNIDLTLSGSGKSPRGKKLFTGIGESVTSSICSSQGIPGLTSNTVGLITGSGCESHRKLIKRKSGDSGKNVKNSPTLGSEKGFNGSGHHNHHHHHPTPHHHVSSTHGGVASQASLPSNPYKPLNAFEKSYLLAVERGDLGGVSRMLSTAPEDFNINCCDPLGRSALLMAIDNENLNMICALLDQGAEMRDALLHAINEEFVEAVELLLDQEDAIWEEGTPHSWEAIERETFTSDITPLILAAHKNNYEIIKILLDRGVSPIPSPHDAHCGCRECREARAQDCLRHSRSRINAYRALASPSLIALSSKDPILTAFELSWDLRRLSFLEPEFKTEYQELRKQCQAFATALLDHTRTTHELDVLLNYDPTGDTSDSHGKMNLLRLKFAIRCKQKKFCAHANVQQLLASIWYEGLPGFRRRNIVVQTVEILLIGLLFPFLSLAYILFPGTNIGQVIKKPFIKFICHSASYVTFLSEYQVLSYLLSSSHPTSHSPSPSPSLCMIVFMKTKQRDININLILAKKSNY